MRRKFAFIIGLVVLAAMGYLFSSGSDARKDVANPPTERYAAAEGKVEVLPGFEVELSSELEGRIESFPVKEGDIVNKGDLIAMMANSDIKAKLRESEAELSVAGSKLKEIASGSREEEIKEAAASLESAKAAMEFERASRDRHSLLFVKGYIPREQLEEKERNLKVAISAVKKAEETKTLLEKGPKKETIGLYEEEIGRAKAAAQYYRKLLEKTYITAPIAGKVIRKYFQEGESVTKDKALAAVADIAQLRINAEVDETDIGMVHPGDRAEIRSDTFAGEVFRGRVEEISDYAGIRKVKPNDQAKNLDMKVVQVKIRLEDKTSLKPGMTVDVKVLPKKNG
ncbi:MAG: HlyD family secretion protein [Nitrospirae bacterium]|nr:HlyD family secretion protein [Nitrospirota bacterium]